MQWQQKERLASRVGMGVEEKGREGRKDGCNSTRKCNLKRRQREIKDKGRRSVPERRDVGRGRGLGENEEREREGGEKKGKERRRGREEDRGRCLFLLSAPCLSLSFTFLAFLDRGSHSSTDGCHPVHIPVSLLLVQKKKKSAAAPSIFVPAAPNGRPRSSLLHTNDRMVCRGITVT